MSPEQYEHFVAKHFEKNGYQVELTSYSNDYGVDVFACKDSKKYAIQAKMFGRTSRKINRKMAMELHGAKDYFDCDYAVIVTDGEILSDAQVVANKLNVELIYIPSESTSNFVTKKKLNFDYIWQECIMPLEGKILTRYDGKINKIKKVDWGGVERITSNNRSQKIDIEIFRYTIEQLINHGSITRKKINDEYPKRASSGIVLILSQVPFIELSLEKPMCLKLVKPL